MHDETAFRSAVRDWLGRILPQRPVPAEHASSDVVPVAAQRWWMAALNQVGLGTPHWPGAYGGVDMSPRLQAILVEEFARAEAPPLDIFMISLNHVPVTLMRWGTEAQKRRYLPEVREGAVWCQGFSEPGAGSDLAALRTRAVRDGDHYVINGHKIWSSFSMYADRAILLARTDPGSTRHSGISFFLMDMKAPGVDVRPVRQANGKSKFAELFLTDVHIPAVDRVGDEGQGWAVAQTTLSAERGLYSLENSERLHRAMEIFLREAVAQGRPWARDSRLRARFAELFARLQSIRALIRDLLFAEDHDGAGTMIAAATIKILFSELRRDYGAFRIEVDPVESVYIGDDTEELSANPMFASLTSFGGMIGGGTNDIMRNIIAERGLGLPRG